MAMQEDWPEESGPRDPWEERGPRKPPVSGASKLLIVLAGLGGLALLLCCGGAYWFWSSLDFELTETPEAAVETTQEIATIQIPPDFQPKRAMRAKIPLLDVEMAVAVYELESGEGQLGLGEMRGDIPQNVEPEIEMRRITEGPSGRRKLQVNRTEVREFEVRGETVRIRFSEAVDDRGNEFRTVDGTFPTEDGTGILFLQAPAEAYDEESVVEMIESIE